MPFCYLCTSGINELFILTPTKPYELSRYNFSLTFCASDIVELNTWNLYKNLTTYNTDEMTHCGLAVLHDITISDHSRTEGWPTAKWAVGYFLFLIPVLIWYWDSQQFVLFLFFSQETNSDLLCVDEKFQSRTSAGQWPIHIKCTILALVLVSGTDEKTHGESFYWNITDYNWYLWKCKTSWSSPWIINVLLLWNMFCLHKY